jgi:hypothetical protein
MPLHVCHTHISARPFIKLIHTSLSSCSDRTGNPESPKTGDVRVSYSYAGVCVCVCVCVRVCACACVCVCMCAYIYICTLCVCVCAWNRACASQCPQPTKGQESLQPTACLVRRASPARSAASQTPRSASTMLVACARKAVHARGTGRESAAHTCVASIGDLSLFAVEVTPTHTPTKCTRTCMHLFSLNARSHHAGALSPALSWDTRAKSISSAAPTQRPRTISTPRAQPRSQAWL